MSLAPLPPDASLDGHRVDALLALAHVGDAILLGIVVLAVVGACLVYRRKGSGSRGGESRSPRFFASPERGESWKARGAVLAVALVAFLGVDGQLFAGTLKDLGHAFWNVDTAEQNPASVRIEVNGQQWSWSARYAGPDGAFGTPDDVVTLNDLRIPVGAPVLIQLGSSDVIHDFSLPNFRIKMDAVPGRIARFWFQATREGTFEIACSQYCGVSHYKMRGVLTVLPRETYDAWVREASALSASADDPADAAAHWAWPWVVKP